MIMVRRFCLWSLMGCVAWSFAPSTSSAGTFDGFHANVYSAIGSGTIKRDDFIGDVGSGPGAVVLNQVEDYRSFERGLSGGFSLGYSRVLNNKWFVSGEGFFSGSGAGDGISSERAYNTYQFDLNVDANNKTCANGAAVCVADNDGRTLRTRDQHTFGFLARGGYKVAPGTLFYGSLGYSVSSVETRYDYSTGNTLQSDFVKSTDNGGFLIGAGSEIMLAKNFSARMDWLHDQREAYDVSVGRYPDYAENEVSGQTLRVGLSWRFGQYDFAGGSQDDDQVELSPGRLLGYKGLGLYAGGQGIYGYVPYNENATIDGNAYRNNDGALNGVGLGFFFGIGTTLDKIWQSNKYRKWYIGIEGGGSYDFTLESEEQEIDGIGGGCNAGATGTPQEGQLLNGNELTCFDRVNVDTEVLYSVSATTRLGYMPNDHSMIYLRFGYGWADYEVKRSAGVRHFGYEGTPPTDTSCSGANYRTVGGASDSWLTEGFVFGLGFESMVNRNVFVRLDWSYLDGDTVSLPGYAVGCGGRDLTANRRINPDINKVSLGVGYAF
ncbi:MAG: hypothetical protein GDA50_01130 [Alphaproteobacteria bacterium GM202ARS2]|nr:hypothetical protein [Alphaproteobacteria bacterium GM202ARS2]